MKARPYIALILLLAFSALLGHNLVPHHHHAEILCTESPQGDHHDCPGHDHETEDHESQHCHAFNNLDLVKSGNAASAPSIQPSGDLIPARSADSAAPPAIPVLALVIPQKIPDLWRPLTGGPGLRAPPAYNT